MLLLLAALGATAWLALHAFVLPDRHGASVDEITIHSKDVGHDEPIDVVTPDGVDPDGAPLLVFLHGRGGDQNDYANSEPFFAALAAQGTRAPVVAFPDGGDSSYWHDRADGKWGSYVTDEVIPAVEKQFGTDPDRVAIGGISMGGFGALDLARLNPGMFCAVGAHSPALWTDGGQSAAGAFDDAEDFGNHDVVAAAAAPGNPYTQLPLWIDEGDEDPFVPGDDAFIANLQAAGGGPHPPRLAGRP